ncbi:hypothetical protein LJR255_003907 [Pararhizobium sp. LjRoot255]|uniref:hypothetical protein n=1 Tax=Pararhizobium sp. LjRoot255 TaxID=3342298 RepID=UPI003ED118D2
MLRRGEEVKEIEKQLSDPAITLNAFILSISLFKDLLNVSGTAKADLEQQNLLFMEDGGPAYLEKLLDKALA